MSLYHSISELVGRTPMMVLHNYMNKYELSANIMAKLEYFNPAGSVKDRVAKTMLDEAEKSGEINKNSFVVFLR